MQIPGWTIDIVTILVSGALSLGIARHTVNKRIDAERDRDIETWYVQAGVQAELAESDWANQILSENTQGDSSEVTLRNRAEKLEEHAAEGVALDADEDTTVALKQLALDFRTAASGIEQSRMDGSDLKEIEDRMWRYVDTIQDQVPDEVQEN